MYYSRHLILESRITKDLKIKNWKKIAEVSLEFKFFATLFEHYISALVIIIRVYCPRAGPSLQAQEPTLQFAPKVGDPPQS